MDIKELKKAMWELNTAFTKVSILMDYADDKTHDAFSTNYPFNKSFDEVAYYVMQWNQKFQDITHKIQ